MKRILPVVAVIVLMAICGGVGCATSAGNVPTQPQNTQSGSTQPRSGATTPSAQNPSGGQPGAPGGLGLSGTVKSVSGSTIQVTGQDGSAVTVKVDDKTTIQKNVTGTLADIQTGVRLMIVGEQSSGTTTARTIQIMPAGESAPQAPPSQAGGQPGSGGNPPSQGSGQPGPGGNPPSQGSGQPGQSGAQPGLGGTVKSVSGNTIQLTGFDGNPVTVKTDDKTTIQKTATATLSDIQANLQITVIGDSSSGTITARMIQIGSGGK